MEVLRTTFEDPVFRYTQMERRGLLAIYSQTHKASSVRRYELIMIQQKAAHTWPTGDTTPAHEAYPSARQLGQYGWTFFTEAAARVALGQHQLRSRSG